MRVALILLALCVPAVAQQPPQQPRVPQWATIISLRNRMVAIYEHDRQRCADEKGDICTTAGEELAMIRDVDRQIQELGGPK